MTDLFSIAAPIPLAEQLPGPEHCDEHDRCWVYMPDLGTWASWRLITLRHINPYHSHWLPFHALPAPSR